MLFNITLKANEQRELNGTGQYFNLLSSSAGKVRIRALDSDAREIISTDILNGDAIEFERLVAKLYVTASEDSAAVLYFSQHKLVNNGVTVKAAGSVKSRKLICSSLTKLNSVIGQNKKIKIKPDRKILIGSQVEQSFSAAKNEILSIETSGDIYCNVDPLVIAPKLNGQETNLLEFDTNQGVTPTLLGVNSLVFAAYQGQGSQLNRLVIDGQYKKFSGFSFPFSSVYGFGVKTLSSCILDEINGVFYITFNHQHSGNWYLYEYKTVDFKVFEIVACEKMEDIFGINASANYFSAFIKKVSQDEQLITYTMRVTTDRLCVLDINKKQFKSRLWSEISSDPNAYLRGHFAGLSENFIYNTQSGGSKPLLKVDKDLIIYDLGLKSYVASHDSDVSGYNGMLFIYSSSVSALIVLDSNGVLLSEISISVLEPGTGLHGRGYSADFFIIKSGTKLTLIDLRTFNGLSVPYQKDAITETDFYPVKVMEDGGGVALVALKTRFTDVNGKQHATKTELTKISGELVPARVEVLELF